MKKSLLKMFDNTTTGPLTKEERDNISLAAMSVLVEADGGLSDLGLLLVRFEETIKDLEKKIGYVHLDKKLFN